MEDPKSVNLKVYNRDMDSPDSSGYVRERTVYGILTVDLNSITTFYYYLSYHNKIHPPAYKECFFIFCLRKVHLCSYTMEANSNKNSSFAVLYWAIVELYFLHLSISSIIRVSLLTCYTFSRLTCTLSFLSPVQVFLCHQHGRCRCRR